VRGSCTEICTEIPCGTSVPCDLCCRSETISTVCGSFHRTISGISILSPAIGKYGHAVSSLRYFPYTFFLYLEVTFVGGTTTYTYVQKVFFFFLLVFSYAERTAESWYRFSSPQTRFSTSSQDVAALISFHRLNIAPKTLSSCNIQ
jgi:hypothetical protein